ncbi:RNA polymerase sigma-70 factor [Rhodohalobacter sp. 614A]|uniref:RNA polymerase sigma-70 factor n=1 Tax=Rhodohalobacter sp. 614A TaxID=2908649 RepID=UPI001F2AA191|nr:RNA polymerase sigma-70 factor [Rhodohalobacter sp. 614A]
MNPKKSDNGSFLSSKHMEEKQWVRQVREEGSRQAFEKIFRAYYKRLHGFAYSYLLQSETAEDVVQSVFLKIWTQRESWDPPGTVKAYLFSAVRNESLNKIRHEKIVAESEEEIISRLGELRKHSSLSDDYDIKELREEIERAINALPPRCRQIFILNRRSGLTYTEIAEYLEISINTVNTQMGRALKSLRDHLSDYLYILFVAGSSSLFF